MDTRDSKAHNLATHDDPDIFDTGHRTHLHRSTQVTVLLLNNPRAPDWFAAIANYSHTATNMDEAAHRMQHTAYRGTSSFLSICPFTNKQAFVYTRSLGPFDSLLTSCHDQRLIHWPQSSLQRLQPITLSWFLRVKSISFPIMLIFSNQLRWLRCTSSSWRKEGNVVFNDTLNTFYLRLYGDGHMVKDHSDSETRKPLPPHRLLFPISSKGSFICIFPQTG